MANKLEEKINNARFIIFMRDPFLGFVLQHYEVFVDESTESAYTNGKFIVLGKKILSSLTLQETIFILLHELLHIILGHIHRGRGYKPKRFNVACDIVVNGIIQSYMYSHGNLKPLFGKDYKIYNDNLSVEEIYELLPDNIYDELLDYHGVWTLIAQKDLMSGNRNLQRIIQEARNKGYASSNSLFTRKLKEIQYTKNVHQWSRILEKYISKDIHDYTYQRVDYRYKDLLLPSFIENELELKNIWFLVDVSGSISDGLLSLMIGEMNRIVSHFKSVSCDISFFSNKTTKPIQFRNPKHLLDVCRNIDTTGGTDFNQIFHSMNEYYKNRLPKLLIILTDGFAKMPDKKNTKNVPVLWISDNIDFKPGFGNKVLIE